VLKSLGGPVHAPEKRSGDAYRDTHRRFFGYDSISARLGAIAYTLA
jgi:hypothetical protein